MEGRIPAAREELYNVQMDMKHVQAVQINHADRLLRIEKRQADDAALKSLWNSPFPSVLGGTLQQSSIPTPGPETFEDLDDEQSHNLLGSLQLETEEEPARRGASRTNSVRFELSGIQGSSWAQPPRPSAEFGPARPTSGFGNLSMTERSLSHKSDGRHSSTGYSVHSFLSAPSGQTSSLGLDTNFIIDGHDDVFPLEIPTAPPGLFILGTVPSIIRCWLNENFCHSTLLYAVICSGSQISHLHISLVEELGLLGRIQKDATGNCSIRLPVYLPEALVTQSIPRTHSPGPQLPAMTVDFKVVGFDKGSGTQSKSTIRVFLGSDALRIHNADLLFSQNVMTLYGADHLKISVPFVRPENDASFKNLRTTNIQPGLGPPKGSEELAAKENNQLPSPRESFQGQDMESWRRQDLATGLPRGKKSNASTSPRTPNRQTSDAARDTNYRRNSATNHHEGSQASEFERRDCPNSVWGLWRTDGIHNTNSDTSQDDRSASFSSRTSNGTRNMKVLKPSKTAQPGRPSVRTGSAYEPPPRSGFTEFRRKSQVGLTENNVPVLRWESKRSTSEEKSSREPRLLTNVSRSNPIGGGSAFAWMATTNSKATSTAAQ